MKVKMWDVCQEIICFLHFPDTGFTPACIQGTSSWITTKPLNLTGPNTTRTSGPTSLKVNVTSDRFSTETFE